jgi:hypothetical protein
MGKEGDLVTDSHHILVMCQNHFSWLLSAHGFSDLRQTEIQTAQLIVPQLSAFQVEIAIEKVKNHHHVLVKSQQQ